jgi:hypothetical protein
MLIILTGLGAYLLARGVLGAIESLRSLPHTNEDWVWY